MSSVGTPAAAAQDRKARRKSTSTSTPPRSKTIASTRGALAKRLVHRLRRPLQLGARIKVVRAEPQVLAARIGLDAAHTQVLGQLERVRMAHGEKGAVVAVFALRLRQQRLEQRLLDEVVGADAPYAELERQLEAGQRLER